MSAIQELDKTLFDGYTAPKAKAAATLLRNGILDSDMDWYETPQPKGMYPPCPTVWAVL
jgi:exocyst complex component 2